MSNFWCKEKLSAKVWEGKGVSPVPGRPLSSCLHRRKLADSWRLSGSAQHLPRRDYQEDESSDLYQIYSTSLSSSCLSNTNRLKSLESNMGSLDLWDYSIELDYLQGTRDLQLAAELGKTLLERNKELEATLLQHQTVIDDQLHEIEFLTRQAVLQKELEENRLRMYEQLEISISELELKNEKLCQQCINQEETIKILNQKLAELRNQIQQNSLDEDEYDYGASTYDEFWTPCSKQSPWFQCFITDSGLHHSRPKSCQDSNTLKDCDQQNSSSVSKVIDETHSCDSNVIETVSEAFSVAITNENDYSDDALTCDIQATLEDDVQINRGSTPTTNQKIDSLSPSLISHLTLSDSAVNEHNVSTSVEMIDTYPLSRSSLQMSYTQNDYLFLLSTLDRYKSNCELIELMHNEFQNEDKIINYDESYDETEFLESHEVISETSYDGSPLADSIHDELLRLEEVRNGKLCRRCLGTIRDSESSILDKDIDDQKYFKILSSEQDHCASTWESCQRCLDGSLIFLLFTSFSMLFMNSLIQRFFNNINQR